MSTNVMESTRKTCKIMSVPKICVLKSVCVLQKFENHFLISIKNDLINVYSRGGCNQYFS